MARQRSPGFKLFLAGLIGIILCIPLVMVYALVYDRESQSQTAQAAAVTGWGAQQTITGPVLVVPYFAETTETEVVDGQQRTRTVRARQELFISPVRQSVETVLDPERRTTAGIYETVVYESANSGAARFEMPGDLDRLGVEQGDLLLDQAELRLGVSDPRGLQGDARLMLSGEELKLQPGGGPAATGGAGFSAFVDWSDQDALDVRWSFGLRGSKAIALVPRGGSTSWQVSSTWPHPSLRGSFKPTTQEIGDDGFTVTYDAITNLALGRPIATTSDDGPPMIENGIDNPVMIEAATYRGRPPEVSGPSMAVSVGLVDPVDLYSQVDRSVKYGFLFIGFTFLAFLMFDIVGGARVAAAEYLLTGAGLVLFFVMLLAFAEMIGFTWAYIVASAAIIGLLTAYSAAVLGTWRRAGFIGALLAGLYGLLFVLLNLETWSLLIGSLLLFAALAGVMYATRRIDWSTVGRSDDEVVEATA